jgi:hypothetical protein
MDECRFPSDNKRADDALALMFSAFKGLFHYCLNKSLAKELLGIWRNLFKPLYEIQQTQIMGEDAFHVKFSCMHIMPST